MFKLILALCFLGCIKDFETYLESNEYPDGYSVVQIPGNELETEMPQSIEILWAMNFCPDSKFATFIQNEVQLSDDKTKIILNREYTCHVYVVYYYSADTVTNIN